MNHMTIAAVSDDSGLHRNTIMNMEKGESFSGLYVAYIISKGVNPFAEG